MIKYGAVKPIKIGYCEGCVFNNMTGNCIRKDYITYPCCDDKGFEHLYIYIRIELHIPLNIYVL
jgi:hypothetical protein